MCFYIQKNSLFFLTDNYLQMNTYMNINFYFYYCNEKKFNVKNQYIILIKKCLKEKNIIFCFFT